MAEMAMQRSAGQREREREREKEKKKENTAVPGGAKPLERPQLAFNHALSR